MEENKIIFGKTDGFEMKILYGVLEAGNPDRTTYSHIHNECEIYVNISGDVSFEVEGTVYPIVSGSAIITRPGEYHHCIYHSNKPHRHYWILFSPYGNERFLDIFFNRRLGRNNLLVFSHDEKARLLEVCDGLLKCTDETEKYYLFFKLMRLLNMSGSSDSPTENTDSFIIKAVDYINTNIGESIKIAELAKKYGMSTVTLERHFKQSLGITPVGYIKKKRLANAARLLSLGDSVTEAAAKSGFSDTSSFIELFRQSYGITPLKYKKSLLNK